MQTAASQTKPTFEAFYDEHYARLGAAWFWRLSDDTADDDPVGPYVSREDAEAAARESLALRG